MFVYSLEPIWAMVTRRVQGPSFWYHFPSIFFASICYQFGYRSLLGLYINRQAGRVGRSSLSSAGLDIKRDSIGLRRLGAPTAWYTIGAIVLG